MLPVYSHSSACPRFSIKEARSSAPSVAPRTYCPHPHLLSSLASALSLPLLLIHYIYHLLDILAEVVQLVSLAFDFAGLDRSPAGVKILSLYLISYSSVNKVDAMLLKLRGCTTLTSLPWDMMPADQRILEDNLLLPASLDLVSVPRRGNKAATQIIPPSPILDTN